MSHLKHVYAGTSVLAMILLSTPAYAQYSGNVLVNSGFEDDVMSAYGNNFSPPTGWTFGNGQGPNIVKVDGPGGQAEWYGSNGPDSDATASGAGVDVQYLDISGGGNEFYQTFRPSCSGEVLFGGYFSTRGNGSTTSSVRIRNGVGLSGSVVGQTNTLTIPGGNSKSDAWTPVDFSATVTANQTYSFVVTMDNNANFDAGYVKFTTGCDAYPPDDTPDPISNDPYDDDPGNPFDPSVPVDCLRCNEPLVFEDLADITMPDVVIESPALPSCCSPWNETVLQESLKYMGSGNIMDPYSLRYTPDASVNATMEAYINYLNALDSGVTSITVHFRLWDKGQTPSSPGLGSQVGTDHYVTWTAGGSSAPSNGGGNFFNLPQGMNINNWYRITSGVYLNDGKEAFGQDCANNEFLMNLEVQSSGMRSAGAGSGSAGGSVTLKTFKAGRIQSKALKTKAMTKEPTPIKRAPVLKRWNKR